MLSMDEEVVQERVLLLASLTLQQGTTGPKYSKSIPTIQTRRHPTYTCNRPDPIQNPKSWNSKKCTSKSSTCQTVKSRLFRVEIGNAVQRACDATNNPKTKSWKVAQSRGKSRKIVQSRAKSWKVVQSRGKSRQVKENFP